jgi:AraC-like DNA-binding protein
MPSSSPDSGSPSGWTIRTTESEAGICHEYLPPRTHPFLDEAWLLHSTTSSRPPRSFVAVPEGHPTLILNFAESFAVHNRGGVDSLVERGAFVGQMTQPLEVSLGDETLVLGLRLHPWTPRTFGLDPRATTDRIHSLGRTFPELVWVWDAAASLASRGAGPGLEAIQMVLEVLQARPILPVDGKLANLAGQLSRRPSNNRSIGLGELAAELGVSIRTVERSFLSTVGLSPKQYAQVLRFRRVLQELRAPDPRWSTIALQSGYYDQAHLINAFRRYTGASPMRFLERQDAVSRLLLFTGTDP